MHKPAICENVDSGKTKAPIFTTDIDILRMASIVLSNIILMHRSISMNRCTPTWNIVHENFMVFYNAFVAFVGLNNKTIVYNLSRQSDTPI